MKRADGAGGNGIDAALAARDDPDYARTVYDAYNDRQVRQPRDATLVGRFFRFFRFFDYRFFQNSKLKKLKKMWNHQRRVVILIVTIWNPCVLFIMCKCLCYYVCMCVVFVCCDCCSGG